MDADSYMVRLVRYIHLNPVEAGLVRDASLHPWTSHRYYLVNDRAPDGLTTDAVLARLARRRSEARKRYQAFVGEGVDPATQTLYARGNWPAIWGSESLRDRVRNQSVASGPNDEIPQSKRERLMKRRGRWNEPRNVAMTLARERWGYALKEIGAAWGGLKYSSIGSMVYAVKRQLDTSRPLAETVARIDQETVKRQS